jgi:hypothetical protein
MSDYFKTLEIIVDTGSKSVDIMPGFFIPPITCVWIDTEEILVILI